MTDTGPEQPDAPQPDRYADPDTERARLGLIAVLDQEETESIPWFHERMNQNLDVLQECSQLLINGSVEEFLDTLRTQPFFLCFLRRLARLAWLRLLIDQGPVWAHQILSSDPPREVE